MDENSTQQTPPEKTTVTEKAAKAAETAQKAAKTAKTVGAATSATASTLTNPLTWIILLIVTVFLAIIVTGIPAAQVWGKNDNADGCYAIGQNSGKSKSGLKHSENREENVQNVGTWLSSTSFGGRWGNKPFTLKMIAGMMGSFGQESGFNSHLTQEGSGLNDKMSNDEILALGNVYGKAIGFAQWDGVRRADLAKYAKANNSHWSDLGTQMDFLKEEIESANGNVLLDNGYTDDSKSVAELVTIFSSKFERPGIPNLPRRIAFGEDFAKNFKPGMKSGGSTSLSKGGGSCFLGGSSADMSGIVELAKSIAWDSNKPDEAKKIPVSPSDPDGVENAKPAYKEAKKKAEEVGGKDTHTERPGAEALYASCDRFVATVVKNTVDPKVPWGATGQQAEYYANSSDWKDVTGKRSDLQPGDILIAGGPGGTAGHTAVFIGDHDGKPSVAQGSWRNEVGAIYPVEHRWSEDLTDLIGQKYKVYRYVGSNAGTPTDKTK